MSGKHALVLLKLEAADRTVYFVMENMYRVPEPGQSEEEQAASLRYFYEEHSCPTNWLDTCVAVIENGDQDPHGFLKYVRHVYVDDNFDADEADEGWHEIFPEVAPNPTGLSEEGGK